MRIEIPATFDEPRLEAFVELLFLAAMADGELSPEERGLFRRRAQAMTDQRLGEGELDRLIVRAEDELTSRGREGLLASVGERLGSQEARETAIRMVVDMMMADKILRTSEREMILEVAETLGVDRNFAADYVKQAGG